MSLHPWWVSRQPESDTFVVEGGTHEVICQDGAAER